MSGFGIYVHFPYCARICPYCDFNIYRARGADFDSLLHVIADEIVRARETLDRPLDTLFIGGGTPSLMSGAQVEKIIGAAQRSFGFAPNAEITLEANPEDAERFADHAAAGVTRFSIGMQALDDDALKALGRNHDAAAARRAVEMAARTDKRVSLDLIYARENQTVAEWSAELRDALTLPIEHVSLYQLTIEDGTAFNRAVSRGTLAPPDNDAAAELYEVTQDICNAAGFPAYEISNHARTNEARSQHNLLYWRGGDWLGLGPGAHGRITRGGVRYASARERLPGKYIDEAKANPDVFTPLTSEEAAQEALLMGLRISEGVERERLTAHPPSETKLAQLAEQGLLTLTQTHIALTARGRLLADRIAAELAP